MIGIFINNEVLNKNNNLTLDKEYKILGIQFGSYYIIDDSNNFITVRSDFFKIKESKIPDFWRKDPENDSRIVPQEWHYENFLFLNDGLEDFIHEEIWSQTQLLKGLVHYNFENIPNNLRLANCDYAKRNIIYSILKTLEVFSNQYRTNASPYLHCNFTKFDDSHLIIASKNNKLEFNDVLIKNEKSFFENLEYILNSIIEYPIIEKNHDDSDSILKRLVYSIWSIFQTDDVEIIIRKYTHQQPLYILKTDNKCFMLSLYLEY